MGKDLDLVPSKEVAAPSSNRGQSEVLSVIRHKVIVGKELEYEGWLREIVPIAGKAEGHRGVNVIRPHPGLHTYTIVLHFDRLEHLERWLGSDIRKSLVRKVQHLLEDGDQVEAATAERCAGGMRDAAWLVSARDTLTLRRTAGKGLR